MPKHKSWLKPADLAFVPKKTPEEIEAENKKQKLKDGLDGMYEMVNREYRRLEREDHTPVSSIDNGRCKNNSQTHKLEEK